MHCFARSTHGIPGRANGSKEVMGHGQDRHNHCSLPSDQCNLPRSPSGTKRFPTCPAAIAASSEILLYKRLGFEVGGFFGCFLLFCSCFDFLMHLFSFNKACYLISPLLSPQEFRPLNKGLSCPPHHTRICLGCCFEMLLECHWGFSQKGKVAFQRQIASFARQSPLSQAASKASHDYFMKSNL